MLRAPLDVDQLQVHMVSMCLCMPIAVALACGALGLGMLLDQNICWGLVWHHVVGCCSPFVSVHAWL